MGTFTVWCMLAPEFLYRGEQALGQGQDLILGLLLLPTLTDFPTLLQLQDHECNLQQHPVA